MVELNFAIFTPHIEGEKCWIIDEDLCIIEL
jgi:hypothetical protein